MTTSTNNLDHLKNAGTAAVRARLDRITNAHKGAREILAEYRTVATAVFAETGIPAVFTDWDFNDPVCRKMDARIPHQYDGLRLAHVAVSYPGGQRFGRFAFFADVRQDGHIWAAPLWLARFVSDSADVQEISRQNMSVRIEAFLTTCADISRGNGVAADF
jgi:hypothetical protein